MENDYRILNGEREALFAKSPLLKALLSPNIDTDPIEWTKNLQLQNVTVQGEMVKALGPNFLNIGVYPLIHVINLLEIFPEDGQVMANLGVVQIVTGIGYQLGSDEDCTTILRETMVRLIEASLLKEIKDENAKNKAGAAIYGSLLAGSSWKHSATGLDPDKEPPDIYEDFFRNNKKFNEDN